jgi:hypothetical protein
VTRRKRNAIIGNLTTKKRFLGSMRCLTSSERSGWHTLPTGVAPRVGQILRMHIERSHMRRFLALVLVALFGALTVSQITRPFSAITLGSAAGLATYYQRFARYTVEEVGEKPVDIATASRYLTFSLPAVEREQDLAVTSMPWIDVTEWASRYLFHRRTPPRSPDDSN